MADFLLDVLRTVAGIGFGALALAFAFATVRLVASGRDAYAANKAITPKSVSSVWSGSLRDDVPDTGRRASHGVAIDLVTGELKRQRRLSTEAVDDVIGRKAI